MFWSLVLFFHCVDTRLAQNLINYFNIETLEVDQKPYKIGIPVHVFNIWLQVDMSELENW